MLEREGEREIRAHRPTAMGFQVAAFGIQETPQDGTYNYITMWVLCPPGLLPNHLPFVFPKLGNKSRPFPGRGAPPVGGRGGGGLVKGFMVLPKNSSWGISVGKGGGGGSGGSGNPRSVPSRFYAGLFGLGLGGGVGSDAKPLSFKRSTPLSDF